MPYVTPPRIMSRTLLPDDTSPHYPQKTMVFNHTHSGHRSQLGIGFKSDEHLIVCLKLQNIKTK